MTAGPFVVVSGPALIGERPGGRNKKDGQLDAYRLINRHVALSLGASYVDTRGALFDRRPQGAPPDVSEGLLTENGEHLNDRGAILVGSMFAKALDGWLQLNAGQILRHDGASLELTASGKNGIMSPGRESSRSENKPGAPVLS